MCVGTLLTQPETEPAGLLELLWYRPSHRLWLHCPSRVVCVVRARCESRTYKTPPHVWAQREGRTHGCWQLSCQQDPTREPRLCARRSDDQRVLVGTVAWPPWVATSLSPGQVEVEVDWNTMPVVHPGAVLLREPAVSWHASPAPRDGLALSPEGLLQMSFPRLVSYRISVRNLPNRCPRRGGERCKLQAAVQTLPPADQLLESWACRGWGGSKRRAGRALRLSSFFEGPSRGVHFRH